MQPGSSTIEDQRELFQYWLAHMDDALSEFFNRFSDTDQNKLDYSPESLAVVESWLIKTFRDAAEIDSSSGKTSLDGAARYIGEVFRKNLGGKWRIQLDDPAHAFFGLPIIAELPGDIAPICPLTEATTSLDRRSGACLTSIFAYMKDRSANKFSDLMEAKKRLGIKD